jgi:hypothetical protein
MRLSLFIFPLVFLLAGCATHVEQVNIVNHSGGLVTNVEVTFGGGSYGRSSIAAESSHQNRIKVFNTGPIQLQFDDANGKHVTSIGPTLNKNSEGSVTVTLDAGGAHWSNQ